ncbi:MAG: hypothetical protein J6Y20_04745 [Lachnospiraceae bacterium]|nr:hypothetical protein [Kiritimatiellia bacterium]MBP5461414.1 hypothetical protein [Lachnospiraceae bacterium]
MTRHEREEYEALKWAGVPEVPEAAGKDTPTWIYAIAKVTTRLMGESFAIVKMNYGRDPIVVKSFSDVGIARIDSVHPYKFLDAKYLPQLRNADETKKYIADSYCVPLEDVAKLKKKELLRLLYAHCIKQQLEDEKKPNNNE